MTSAEILSRLETCARAGYWARDWERRQLDGVEMLQHALRAALTETARQDIGELAGETVMELAADRGLHTSTQRIYDSAVHHAALADILAQAIRRQGTPAWQPLQASESTWSPSCYVDASGSHLRRIVMVSHWSDERHYSEARSWHSLGEIAHYGLPMQQVVLVLGQMRDGRRNGPFSKGFLHPQKSHLRFRRKTKNRSATFNESWTPVWREDIGGEIPVSRWMQAMLDDDILRDVSFTVELPVPTGKECQAVKDMAQRKLEAVARLSEVPDGNLSTCFWPSLCIFQPECHSGRRPDGNRFVRIEEKSRAQSGP